MPERCKEGSKRCPQEKGGTGSSRPTVFLERVRTLNSGLRPAARSSSLQGAGKQRLGVLVNIVAFYVCAIPTALLLAFRLGWGVEGMYTGMLLGPAIQVGGEGRGGACVQGRSGWFGRHV